MGLLDKSVPYSTYITSSSSSQAASDSIYSTNTTHITDSNTYFGSSSVQEVTDIALNFDLFLTLHGLDSLCIKGITGPIFDQVSS
jgi:hypothetical protein